jgi:hypothetical protein
MNVLGREIRVAVLAVPAASADDIVIRRDPSKAVYVPAPPPPASPDTGAGFQLDDAGIGAAGMLTIVLGLAGVASLRGRRHSARPIGAS